MRTQSISDLCLQWLCSKFKRSSLDFRSGLESRMSVLICLFGGSGVNTRDILWISDRDSNPECLCWFVSSVVLKLIQEKSSGFPIGTRIQHVCADFYLNLAHCGPNSLLASYSFSSVDMCVLGPKQWNFLFKRESQRHYSLCYTWRPWSCGSKLNIGFRWV